MPAEEPPPPTTEGHDRFTVGTWLFLRLLALIHLVAFISFWTQLDSLIGPRGLLPATRFFTAVHDQIGSSAYAQLPSLCWWCGAETFLTVLCAAGVVLALLLFVGIAPALCLGLLWVAYLSLSCAGQQFFNFQWDALLLETTLLAIVVAPWSLVSWWRAHEPPRFARLLVAWLLFRLMFLSGVVKLTSGDPTWRDLSALTFHYETQPLPTVLGWYAHQLPTWWHRASCAGMFVIELVAPFLFFAPRPLRHNAILLTIALMVIIALTGNYTFFNLLTIALCVGCLDDAFWRSCVPTACRGKCHVIRDTFPGPRPAPTGVVVAFGAAVFLYTLLQALPAVVPRLGTPPGYQAVANIVGPFRSLNNYGLFAVMTNPRPELVFEGSDDGRTWQAYEFPHKPGALGRRPTWVAPHQPRLDWQLWFAALGSLQQNQWVLALGEHLLRGTPASAALLAHNPFPQKPPRFIRIVRYEYHFTDAATRAATGNWWRRTPLDLYLPSASLK